MRSIPMYIDRSEHWDTFMPIYKRIVSHRQSQEEEDEANSPIDLTRSATLPHGLTPDVDISNTV